MTCDRLRDDELEAYLAGTLGDADMTRVELHVFDCTPCFETLEVLRATRTVLQTDGARRVAWWQTREFAIAASIAAIVAIGGVVRYARPASPTQVASSAPSVEAPPAPVASTAPVTTTTPPPATPPLPTEHPTPSPGATPPTPTPASPADALRRLVRFDAPPVLALTVRSSDQPAEMSPALTGAVRAYMQGSYRAAFSGFAALAPAERELPAAQYFGGISALKAGRTSDARAWLTRASQANHPTTAVEAWLYLAYTRLQGGDAAGAVQALDRYLELDGDRVAAARTLRDDILATAPHR